MEPPFFPNPSILIDFLVKKWKRSIGIDRPWHCGHFGLCIFWETSIFFIKNRWDVVFGDFSMIFCKNGCKVLSIRGITGESGILDPIKFW